MIFDFLGGRSSFRVITPTDGEDVLSMNNLHFY